MRKYKKMLTGLMTICAILGLASCGGSNNSNSNGNSKSPTTNDNNEMIADDEMYFGTYPQTDVTSTKGTELSTAYAFDSSTWTDYGYYISGSVSSYMYYYDVDTNKDGSYDYRGVYFTSYRTYFTNSEASTSNSYQDDNGYNINTIYWFSYDPIKWNVLETKDGKALIITDMLLDSQDYNYTTFSQTVDGNTVGANNYMYSHIRSWLNDTFYTTAFNELEKELIETTEVDNSASTTASSSNSYACANTNDKIFLLSYKEVYAYYTSHDARCAKTSEYAKCQGAYTSNSGSNLGNGYWWLRSPCSSYSSGAYFVNLGVDIGYGDVYDTFYGVRAACWINL